MLVISLLYGIQIIVRAEDKVTQAIVALQWAAKGCQGFAHFVHITRFDVQLLLREGEEKQGQSHVLVAFSWASSTSFFKMQNVRLSYSRFDYMCRGAAFSTSLLFRI